MADVLIVNASPLIFLGNAGRIDLLRATGAGRVIVPEPVFDEVISGGYTDKAARALSEAAWIEKRTSPPIPESVVAWDPRAVLLQLRAAGMWLSDTVIARALRIAGIEP
jgi:predicted nucleic acid-binding protein